MVRTIKTDAVMKTASTTRSPAPFCSYMAVIVPTMYDMERVKTPSK